MTTAATEVRDVAIVATFAQQVDRLTEHAGMVRVKVDAVAPHLDLVVGAALQGQCEQVVGVIADTAAVIGHQLAQVWTESDEEQAAAADLGLEIVVHHARDRREWDHRQIAHDYVARRLAQREAEGLPAPSVFDVVDWVLEACLPSYWRKAVLAAVGMDADAYSKGRDERPAGHARKVADPGAVTETRRATPAPGDTSQENAHV